MGSEIWHYLNFEIGFFYVLQNLALNRKSLNIYFSNLTCEISTGKSFFFLLLFGERKQLQMYSVFISKLRLVFFRLHRKTDRDKSQQNEIIRANISLAASLFILGARPYIVYLSHNSTDSPRNCEERPKWASAISKMQSV